MRNILNRLGLYLFTGCISITSLYAEDIGTKTVATPHTIEAFILEWVVE